MPAIEVESLRVAYGERVAVEDLSFTADAGEVVALLGPNGAGKTSTVETLEGYRSPSAGRVRVLGLDPVAEHGRLVRRIGVVLQRGGVYPVMSPRRVLRLFASYYEDPREPDALLEEVGLRSVAATPYRRLSGGEQQRLALALALVGRPHVCFLDEPTAGIDPAGRVAMRDVVARLRDDGVCVLLTSHELDEVERIASRVVIIDHGRLLAAGEPGSLAGTARVRFRVRGELDTEALGRALGVAVVMEGGAGYRLDGEPRPDLVARLTAWLTGEGLVLEELHTGQERLEETFLRLVAGSEEG